MILKKALMYSNSFYKSTCKNGRMLIIFYRQALWGLIILSFLIFHTCIKFSVAKNENRAEICNSYLLSGVNSFSDNAIYITRLHLIYSPLKSVAEVGSLVTSLIRLPLTILSSPHNDLRTIISISKLSNTLRSLQILLSFLLLTNIFWNFLAFFSEH